jgi:ComF family protein
MKLPLAMAVELCLTLLSPSRCAACGERAEHRAVFCAPCARTVEPAPKGPVRAPFAYGGALSRAITRFKYEDCPHLARPLGQLLLRLVPELRAEGIDRIVPVPLHPARLAQRGFNPPALLARPVAQALAVPLSPLGLRRTRDTLRQAHLDRRLRLGNVEGAFQARGTFAGEHVLLVDDVCTTGSTLRVCAASLRAAGARRVTGLVLALAL